jgi:large subunit ribosomal protein L11
MAKKKVIRHSSIQLICGQAKPGANLAFLKNAALFCKEFNNSEKAKSRMGEIVNVKITIYEDKSYEYSIGTSPSTYFLKGRRSDYKLLKSKGSSGKEERKKAQDSERKEISEAELEKIAQKMMPSLNTDDMEKAKKILKGTVRSLGKFKIAEN